MSVRGGRERSRRDSMTPALLSSSSRFEEKTRTNNNNPPSRHLWVGNVSHRIHAESVLSEHFLRFGPLDSISFLPGRSYGFVNFEREEDAVAAMNALQGFVLAELPLKIEFSKSDKSNVPSRDQSYLRRDEKRAVSRGSPFSQRESRMRHPSPDAFLPENFKADDHSEDTPSEVLWIGFPSLLKVDETILRRAFSPFGEIDKVTVFPGRSYAFVRFRSLMSSCRAKETLQGKLFGNPRVHIRFAKSETGWSSSARRGSGLDAPPSPHFRNGHSESFDSFQPDRNFEDLAEDHNIRQQSYASNVDYRDSNMVSFGMNEPSWKGGNVDYGQKRFNELGPEPGFSEGLQGYHNTPVIGGSGHFREFSPPQFPRKHPLPEDPWDSPESVYDGAKRMKMGPGRFPPDKELPEYPFSVSEQGKHVFPKMFPEVPPSDEAGPMRYVQIPDLPLNTIQPFGDRSESWKRPTPDLLQQPSHDTFHPTSASFPANPVEWKRPTPDIHQQPVTQEWKWEGTIAKGGTPVCRARCFPVGKVLDIMLPEFLDCTARTGLDMLAKHYYQAAGTWVVFFVPQSDADIGYYNEFMNYLGEKQRAAVAKIDERNTLFLVPPSDFSEKVLKVPGKLSISGVVLRLEPPSSNPGSVQAAHERRASHFMPPLSDMPYQRSDSPSGPFPPVMSYQNIEKPGFIGSSLPINGSTSQVGPSMPLLGYDNITRGFPDAVDRRSEFPPNHHAAAALAPNLSSPHQLQQGLVPGIRNTSSHAPHGAVEPMQEPTNMGNYASGYSAPVSGTGSNKSSFEEPKPTAFNAFQPEQLALLASSLLGQQRQQLQAGSSSTVSGGEDYNRSSTMNQAGNPPAPPRYTNQVPSEHHTTRYGQLQQSANVPAVAQSQVNQQPPSNNANTQEEGEADPQKRLQATLQLAAALLQQIQQGKGT
ncbi:hypothetical protein Dimus_009795 [Dionaea muscipula]